MNAPTRQVVNTGLEVVIAVLLVAGGWLAHSAVTDTPRPTTTYQPGITVPQNQPTEETHSNAI